MGGTRGLGECPGSRSNQELMAPVRLPVGCSTDSNEQGYPAGRVGQGWDLAGSKAGPTLFLQFYTSK